MRMWCIYTIEYYLAVKKKIVKLSGKCVELEIILLNEVTQKDKHCMFSLHVDAIC